jgi:hypothetical protein
MTRLTVGARSALGIVALIAIAALGGGLLWPAPPGATVLHTGTAHYVVAIVIESQRIGVTFVDVDLTVRSGAAPPDAVVTVQAVMPLTGHTTAPVRAVRVGSTRYRGEGVPLMTTGPGELLLTIDDSHGVEHLTLPVWVTG